MMLQVAKTFFTELQAIFRHRLAIGASLLAASQYGTAALNIVANVLMARLLGPTDYGLVALTIAYPTLLWSFVGVKSVSVTTMYVAAFRAKREHEKLKAVVKLGYGLDLFVSLLALISVALTSWWVSQNFYRQPHLAWLMVVYAGSFPFFALTGTSWAVLSSWERFQWLAVLEVLHPFIKLCLVVGFLLLGFGIAGAVIAMSLAQVSIGLIMMVAATNLLHREGIGTWWKVSLRSVAPLKQELMGFFGWNYLLVTLSGLIAQIPIMLLGHLRGPEEAGFYRIAVSIGTVGSYLETSLGRVTYPILSARWTSEERENIINALKRWTLKVGLPISVTLIFTTLFFPWLLPLLYGHDYHPAVLGAQIIMLGVAVSALFFWLNSFYYASGRINLWVSSYALYIMLVIGLGWFAIKQWGFLGLACLVAIGKVLFTILMFMLLPRSEVKLK